MNELASKVQTRGTAEDLARVPGRRRFRKMQGAAIAAAIFLLFAVWHKNPVSARGSFDWKLPPGFPLPHVPADNPMSAAKVELGRHLFYDKRLSFNQRQACASCHQQSLAFTDGRARAKGSTGQIHPRSSMTLVNVAYVPALAWANPGLTQLEAQALIPMFGDDPVELGMQGREGLLLERLKAVPEYQRWFPAAFPDAKDPFTVTSVVRALASFQRTILSGDSPYDRYWRGADPDALSVSAKRGEYIFFSEKFQCFHCHGGLNFANAEDFAGKGFTEIEFDNTGLYNVKGETSYPSPNTGLFEFTRRRVDIGKFRVPTLRNITVTAPYMHDGSARTLEEVLDHYSAGGRTILKGRKAGVGAANPNKSIFLSGFNATDEERTDLIEFLKSLTDVRVLTDPAFSDPWKKAKS
jgi:cytochrome c peroxidase